MEITPCTAGINKLNVSPSGEVFPCEAFKWLGKQNLRPSVFEVPLASIWKYDPLLNLLRNWKIPQCCLCSGCEIAETCRGGCKGQALLFWSEDQLIEWLKQANRRVYGKHCGCERPENRIEKVE